MSTSVHHRRTFGIPEHARKMNTCASHIGRPSHPAELGSATFGTLPPRVWSPENPQNGPWQGGVRNFRGCVA